MCCLFLFLVIVCQFLSIFLIIWFHFNKGLSLFCFWFLGCQSATCDVQLLSNIITLWIMCIISIQFFPPCNYWNYFKWKYFLKSCYKVVISQFGVFYNWIDCLHLLGLLFPLFFLVFNLLNATCLQTFVWFYYSRFWIYAIKYCRLKARWDFWPVSFKKHNHWNITWHLKKKKMYRSHLIRLKKITWTDYWLRCHVKFDDARKIVHNYFFLSFLQKNKGVTPDIIFLLPHVKFLQNMLSGYWW